MGTDSKFDEAVSRWLDESAPVRLPERVLDATFERTRQTRQHVGWRAFPGRTQTISRTFVALGGIAAVALVILAGAFVLGLNARPPAVGATPSPSPAVTPSAELLNGFLEARVAGGGAQQYLNVPEEDVPLLYATTSGAPYERADFEPVLGIEWPYGFTAFKVRLFAGDTVVEQLFFMPHDDPRWFPADGRLGLEYQPDGFATHIAPTTEDGQPLAVPYNFFDGEVTLHAAHPWVRQGDSGAIRLIPDGPGVQPTTDGGQRIDWDELILMGDPVPVAVGTDCQPGPSPADAKALAESIRSDPDVGATAPVAVSAGGTDGLWMDVAIAAGATVCAPATSGGDPLQNAVLRPVFDTNGEWVYANGVATGHATGDWMRLYLFDVPEGSSIRILAIAIVAQESSFERAVEAAAPILESVEFHTP